LLFYNKINFSKTVVLLFYNKINVIGKEKEFIIKYWRFLIVIMIIMKKQIIGKVKKQNTVIIPLDTGNGN